MQRILTNWRKLSWLQKAQVLLGLPMTWLPMLAFCAFVLLWESACLVGRSIRDSFLMLGDTLFN